MSYYVYLIFFAVNDLKISQNMLYFEFKLYNFVKIRLKSIIEIIYEKNSSYSFMVCALTNIVSPRHFF